LRSETRKPGRSVERMLDALPWRALEAIYRLGRATRRRSTLWRRRAAVAWRLGDPTTDVPSSRHPLRREMAALEAARRQAAGRHEGAALKVDLLRVALGGGAYGQASDLAADILTGLGNLDRAHRKKALAANRRDLELSSPGVSLLVMLGDRAAERQVVLPGGQLNALALSRRIEAGGLGAEELLQLLLNHRVALLRNPELHLLLSAACRQTDPQRATAALNRLLRAHALPPCTVSDGSSPDGSSVSGSWDNLLRNIRFRPVAARRSGPLVSVLMAAHDAAATIEYAIDSLLAQSYRQLEVLVCDDASSDGTLQLVKGKYAAEPRVRIFASTKNQGPYNLRNQLIDQARGHYLTFHDADDLALPTRIEAQVERMRRGAVACYTCFIRVTPDGRFVFMRDQRAVRLCMVTLMTRRSVLDALGRFRPAWFGADLELREMLRHRHGDARIPIIRQPLLFGLWSESSATRAAGSESGQDGYRSPARRAYAERVFDALAPDHAQTDAQTERVLRATGNSATSAAIVEDPAGERIRQRISDSRH